MNVASTRALCPLGAVCLAALSSTALAQQGDALTAPRVEVIGRQENLDRIPGAGYILDKETLESSRVFTTSEALRKIPGVNARDEEGFSMRPNIGIRGLNPTRSTKITLLEDGIPLAYAPYGDNASYFHPPIERYERIEVLKGAGQVLYGPQTIGGVVNYITPDPPSGFQGSLTLTGGSRDYLNAHARLGGGGWLFDYTHKQGQGNRDNTWLQVDDINLKKLIEIDARQALILRANAYQENSQVGYTGLTAAEWNNFGARYNPFPNDFFDTRRYALAATHQIQLSEAARLVTNVYGSHFERDWWRQSSSTLDTLCGTAFRDDRLAGLPVDPNTQCAGISPTRQNEGRLRNYSQAGIEPRLQYVYTAFGVANEMQTGVRIHAETQSRRQIAGATPLARDGLVQEDNLRDSVAYAAFAQNKLLFGDLTLAPGLRYEYIDNHRDNRLNGLSGEANTAKLLPSLGANYKLDAATNFFAGVHRGFAPPRVEDQINTTGGNTPTSTNVNPELSWNYELGVRSSAVRNTNIQATVFRNDFERLVAVGSVAGNVPLSEGRALYQGMELAARYAAPGGFYGTLALTWLPVADQQSAFRQVSNGQAIQNSQPGNRLPYAPRHTATLALGYMTPSGLDANVEAVHVGSQFADFANVGDAATDPNMPGTGADQSRNRASGQFGRIDSFTVFNAALNYKLSAYRVTLFLAVKNIADKTYIVDRTRGIVPGMPRLIQAGFRYDF
jgi:Fe(3+) dicitrate transport protein